MSLYGMENFAYGNVAATFTNSQTTLSMFTGHTSRFTTFPFMAVLFNITDHDVPHEAFFEPTTPDAEIIEIVSKSGDTFDVIKRGQDGTSAIATTPGKTYRVAVVASRSQWDKVCRAQPDAAGPFDAILGGTALALAGAVARFVNSGVVTDDALLSLQSGSNSGSESGLVFGDESTAELGYLKYDVGQKKLEISIEGVGIIAKLGQNGIGNLWGFPAAGSTVYENHFKDQVGFSDGNIIYAINATQVISSGAIDILDNGPFVVVDTAGAASTDDLDTLNGGTQGEIVLLRAANNARTVVVKHAVDNIHLIGDVDFSLTTSNSVICLWKRNASTFFELWRAEHL